MKSALAVITFVDHQGNPIDPDFGGGLPAGGGHPDQGLPPGFSGHPDQGLPGRPGRPSTGPVRPPHTWPPSSPNWPPDPTDPEWGISADRPSHPIYIPIGPDNSLPGGAPGHPDNTLPPVAGHKPPPDAPPGTIWPPLPPGAKPGKAALLFWLEGVGYRYVVVDLSNEVDNTLPSGGARPGHDLPQTPQPK